MLISVVCMITLKIIFNRISVVLLVSCIDLQFDNVILLKGLLTVGFFTCKTVCECECMHDWVGRKRVCECNGLFIPCV